MYRVVFLLDVAVILLAVNAWAVDEVNSTSPNEVFERNIRDGFAAKSGFEIVSVDSVPVESERRSRPAGGFKYVEYVESVTYRLDPHIDAYQITEEGLGHIKWVTFAWRKERQESPFIFDLYLHGDPDSDNRLAVRVASLDIRKFLHQSIAHLSDNLRLARLQAYFAEFSRKAKIIDLLPLSSKDRVESSQVYENSLLSELHRSLVRVIQSLKEGDERELKSLNQALRQFEQNEPPRLDIIYRNLQVAIDSGREKGISSGETLEKKTAIDQLVEIVSRIIIARRILNLKITNNCREPGNYEIEIRDRLRRPLLRANFSIPTHQYNDILTRYHGLGIRKQGTGIGVPSTIRNREWLRYWDSFLPWKWSKSFPRVTIDALSMIRAPDGSEGATTTPIKGEIEVVNGQIPFNEYDVEVRSKSAYHYHGSEPLSYVRVDPNFPPPVGFESPDGVQQIEYWTSKVNAGKVVPHHFQNFEDLQRYDVFLSGFDLNGVYIGRSELREYIREGQEGRWHFNFQYLRDLKLFELRQWRNGGVEIRIMSKAVDPEPVNFIFGNFSIEVGEAAEFLFGIGTQPLITAYNHNVYRDPLLYGLAYGADGTILDHHDQGIGVEKIYIERIDPWSYRLRLISYERILPVWEGIIRIPRKAPVNPETTL